MADVQQQGNAVCLALGMLRAGVPGGRVDNVLSSNHTIVVREKWHCRPLGVAGAGGPCPYRQPAPSSLRTWLCLHLRQHAEHERQQLVQGVEPGYLVGGQMLDAAAP